MKIILSIFLMISLNISANELKLKEIIAESYPDLKIKGIKKTNFNDLYEIFLGD